MSFRWFMSGTVWTVNFGDCLLKRASEALVVCLPG